MQAGELVFAFGRGSRTRANEDAASSNGGRHWHGRPCGPVSEVGQRLAMPPNSLPGFPLKSVRNIASICSGVSLAMHARSSRTFSRRLPAPAGCRTGHGHPASGEDLVDRVIGNRRPAGIGFQVVEPRAGNADRYRRRVFPGTRQHLDHVVGFLAEGGIRGGGTHPRGAER